MLTHATDDFLDIADDDVAALRRSVDPVTFSGPGDEHFEVQAFLVLHREQARLVCHAALRCRALKRPVVFAVTAASPVALLEVGSAQLEQLGFELRDVNLNLSPALRQVVLRDIPVLRPPDSASAHPPVPAAGLTHVAGLSTGGDSASAIARQAEQHRAHAERNLLRKLQHLRTSLERQLQQPPVSLTASPSLLLPEPVAAGEALAGADALAAERANRLQAEALLAVAQQEIGRLTDQLAGDAGQGDELLTVRQRLDEREKQLAALTGDLTGSAARLVAAEERCTTLAAELADAGRRLDEQRAVNEALRRENRAAQRRIRALEKQVGKLEAAELPAAARQKLAELEGERDRERARCFELLAANRRQELELAAGREKEALLTAQLRDAERTVAAGVAGQDEQARLRVALAEARASVAGERQARQAAEAGRDGLAAELAGVRRDYQALAQACAVADLRRADGESPLRAAAASGVATAAAAEPVPVTVGLLPHQLRPAPRPGALFRPDWDLPGLPCRSAEQVVQAWESVYNVQLALEGYPSQYCAAFLVVLREGRRKRPYLLFRLKQNKHTLVCVPGQPVSDEAALGKLLSEGQQYLKRSGFDMIKLAADEVAGTLGGYFSLA